MQYVTTGCEGLELELGGSTGRKLSNLASFLGLLKRSKQEV